MVITKDFIDKRGREINMFCGEEGWRVKFKDELHFLEEDIGCEENLKRAMKHIKDFFGDVKEIRKNK